MTYEMKVIARIESDFDTKFGVPRQSGLVKSALSRIVFEKEYRNPDALRGMDGFSHLWLIWVFSEAVRDGWSPTVRPPRLGGNTRMGVFATRSPFRPNAIGLSSVEIDRVENDPERGPVIWVRGADLMNGTPILDVKPYLPYTDSHPEAIGGFLLGNIVSGLLLSLFMSNAGGLWDNSKKYVEAGNEGGKLPSLLLQRKCMAIHPVTQWCYP